MQKGISGLLIVMTLLCGMWGGETGRAAYASEVSSDRSDRGRPEIVHGLLDEFGPGFVVVDGFRYRTAPHLVVKNQQGEIASSGMKALGPQMMVELVLESHLVVQIQIVSLPR